MTLHWGASLLVDITILHVWAGMEKRKVNMAAGGRLQKRGRVAMLMLVALSHSLVACGTLGEQTPTATSIATPTELATLMVGNMVDTKEARPGEVLQYTLVVMDDQLDGEDPGTNVRLVSRLPDTLELVADSLSSHATYDALTRSILWNGRVPRGLSVEVSFRARLTPAAATMRSVVNTVVVTDAFGRATERSAQTQVIHPAPTATPTAGAP